MSEQKTNQIPVSYDSLKLNFPEPDSPLLESHLRKKISWAKCVRETEPARKRYMANYDSREQRLRDPDETRFVL
jgi:hypothetical protein